MIVALLGLAAIAGGTALMVRVTAHRRRRWSDRTTRRLAWAAVAWAGLAGVALLVVPTVSTSSTGAVSSSAPTAEVTTTTSRETLPEQEGAGVVAALLVPVAVALAGALGKGPVTRRRRITAGSALTGACILGAASVGVFFLPAAVALLTAGLRSTGGTAGPRRAPDAL